MHDQFINTDTINNSKSLKVCKKAMNGKSAWTDKP